VDWEGMDWETWRECVDWEDWQVRWECTGRGSAQVK
jgi:hypothetical protein